MALKRLAAPALWPVEKKTKKFVIRPIPGPHRKERCLPLGIIIRDIMGYAKDLKEVKQILNSGVVKIDGTVRKHRGFPVGLMDIVTIGEERYVILPDAHGLRLSKTRSATKLLRIENKRYVGGGKIQLNLHDGKNILVGENVHKQGDVILFDTGKKSIKDVIRFEKDQKVILIRGSNTGSVGKIEEIAITKSPMPNQVVVDISGRKISVPKDCVFAVGDFLEGVAYERP